MNHRIVLLMAGVATAVSITGCSVATPDPSQMALHYSGGPFSNQDFENCIKPGDREVDSPNDSHDFYPVGQRSWDFSTKPGADAPPIQISTKNQTELIDSGSVTFTLDTDCTPYQEYRTDPITGKRTLVHTWPGGLIQRFHDTIGRHTNAYATDGGEPQPQGWNDDVSLYLGGPLTIAMNTAALNFAWEDLYNNAQAKAAWQAQVESQLQTLVDQKAGARHFIVNQVQLGKPDLPPLLKGELENNQAATIRANTANIDKSAASNFPGGIAGYINYQVQLAIAKAIGDGKVRVVPVPTGSIVSVPGA